MASVKITQKFDTELFADSVEWCPHTQHQDILLCGTYQLDESQEKSTTEEVSNSAKKQTRHGKLYAYKLCYHENEDVNLQKKVVVDMPGILDIKWCASLQNGKSLFALVNSAGQLMLLHYNDTELSVCLETILSKELGDGCLGLSLDWSNKFNGSMPTLVTSSSSDGYVHIHTIDGGSLAPLSKWKAHDFEAWITAFNNWDTNLVYSGGDDCRLKGWDIRLDQSQPVFSSKRHSMGVTSIQSSPVMEHILCTGSYDENLLVWDSRSMRHPISETSIGGGIWRIKWEPGGNRILTATMYNGYHILDAENITEESLPILYHYQQKDILAYGADWCYQDDSRPDVTSHNESVKTCEIPKTVATCSFYDHTLQLWEIYKNQPSVIT